MKTLAALILWLLSGADPECGVRLGGFSLVCEQAPALPPPPPPGDENELAESVVGGDGLSVRDEMVRISNGF